MFYAININAAPLYSIKDAIVPDTGLAIQNSSGPKV